MQGNHVFRWTRADLEGALASVGGIDGVLGLLDTMSSMAAIATGTEIDSGIVGKVGDFIKHCLKRPGKLIYEADDTRIEIVLSE